ncbi:F-actin-capping protein subunit alpha [Tanacetum coccineum]
MAALTGNLIVFVDEMQSLVAFLSHLLVLISSYSEISEGEYLDPRTAQVGKVDHVRQICTGMRPARDEELPSHYVEEYRCALDAEMSKYVGEAYPKGVFSVYCTSGKDAEESVSDFELVVVITATRHSPQNFCNGSWRSIWNIEFKDELQTVEVTAHYFEEGNVQLDAKHECRDSTMYQSPDDSAISLMNIISHHEAEYLTSLQASYSNLPDSTFKVVTGKDQREGADKESSPVMVLDEECLVEKDVSKSLFGRVKEFASLANLKVAICNEGFEEINISYMGELWVKLDFKLVESIKKFKENLSIGSWFTCIKQAVMDFVIEGRIAKGYWIRASESNGWVPDFTDEEEEEELEDNISNDGVVNKTEMGGKNEQDGDSLKFPPGFTPKEEHVVKTMLDGEVQNNGKDNGDCLSQNHSTDPFGIYDLINKKRDCQSDGKIQPENSAPPGFSHKEDGRTKDDSPNDTEEIPEQNKEQEKKDSESHKEKCRKKTTSDNLGSCSSGHFKKSNGPRSGGSIIHWIEELVNVGQVKRGIRSCQDCLEKFGHKLLSLKDDEWFTMNFLSLNVQGLAQKAKKDWVKKICVSNKAVGMSGGILCIWDDTIFQKKNRIVSDNFVIVSGVWIPSGKNLLVISVYAPQDLRDKKLLWDYLCSQICSWEGDVEELERDVSREEVKRAVWDCGVEKSPGPDGFTFGFYRRYWNLIEEDVFKAVVFGFIFTTVVIYKVIAKILANRLVTVLEDIVSESQSAFVKDRQILDGPLILNELVQWCKKAKQQSMFFKVDFEKAYIPRKWITRGINLKLITIGMDQAVRRLVQRYLKMGPFNYLGSQVGSLMSRSMSGNSSLGKNDKTAIYWKLKTISIGGRLTLLKSILGSTPLYHMSMFRVPKQVLQQMERIRARFFNGTDIKSKIIDIWRDEVAFKDLYPRLYMLENMKELTVAHKLAQEDLEWSFRRKVRSGCEMQQLNSLKAKIEGVILNNSSDRWTWSLEGSGEFSVSSLRKEIDSVYLPQSGKKTRWN